MKILCTAPSCKYSSENEDSSNIIFISFPNNDAASLWALKCGRHDLVGKPIEYLHKNQYICSSHIEDRHFINKKDPIIIASEAVPTIFGETKNSASPNNSFDLEYRAKKVGCSVNSIRGIRVEDEMSRYKIIFNTDGSNGQDMIFDKNEQNYTDRHQSFCHEALNVNQLREMSASLNNLCRMCGKHIVDGIDIVTGEGSKLGLKEKIELHTPISLDAEEAMPQKICPECCGKLEATHSLVLACLQTDLRLRKYLNVGSKHMYDRKYADLLAMYTTNVTNEDNAEKIHIDNPWTNDEYDNKLRNNSTIVQLEQAEIGRVIESNNDNISTIKYIVHSDLNNLLQTLDVETPKTDEKIDQSSKQTNVNEEEKINSKFTCSKCNNTFDASESLENHICDCQKLENQKASDDLESNVICQMCELIFVDMELYEKHKISCEENLLKCNFNSSEIVNGKNDLDKHEISRLNANNRCCGHCPSSFETRKELQSHIIDRHDSQPLYKCPLCDKTYEKWSSLDVHEATHRIDKPYLCDLCGKSFKHSNNLRGHKRIHLDESKKKRHVCDVCGNAFRSRFHLREHTNQHNGNKPYKCENCAKAFYKRIQLRQHRLSHGSNKHACPICGVTFNRRGNMNTHLKRHNRSEGIYTCSVCEYKCTSMSELKMHRKEHSESDITDSIKMKNANRITYRCDICDKVFPKRAILLNHEITHSNDRMRIECKTCGKKLANKSSLRYHERSLHSTERPHMCQYCGESFVSKSSRLIHERIHTGERPYTCEICNMQYRCSSNLSQHMKIHSSLRPYVCKHCNKTFTRKGALNVHERIHSDLKPFNCESCDCTFSRKNDMMKHAKIHRSKIVKCEKCSETFENKSEVLEHLNSHEESSMKKIVSIEYAVISQPLENNDIGINC